MSTYVSTLHDNDGNDIAPRTKVNAIYDKNGNYLDNDLMAADLNPLKGGADKLVIHTNDAVGTAAPVNADKLNGHDDTYFATAAALSSLSSTCVFGKVLCGGVSNVVTAGSTWTQIGTVAIPAPTDPNKQYLRGFVVATTSWNSGKPMRISVGLSSNATHNEAVGYNQNGDYYGASTASEFHGNYPNGTTIYFHEVLGDGGRGDISYYIIYDYYAG